MSTVVSEMCKRQYRVNQPRNETINGSRGLCLAQSHASRHTEWWFFQHLIEFTQRFPSISARLIIVPFILCLCVLLLLPLLFAVVSRANSTRRSPGWIVAVQPERADFRANRRSAEICAHFYVQFRGLKGHTNFLFCYSLSFIYSLPNRYNGQKNRLHSTWHWCIELERMRKTGGRIHKKNRITVRKPHHDENLILLKLKSILNAYWIGENYDWSVVWRGVFFVCVCCSLVSCGFVQFRWHLYVTFYNPIGNCWACSWLVFFLLPGCLICQRACVIS